MYSKIIIIIFAILGDNDVEFSVAQRLFGRDRADNNSIGLVVYINKHFLYNKSICIL